MSKSGEKQKKNVKKRNSRVSENTENNSILEILLRRVAMPRKPKFERRSRAKKVPEPLSRVSILSKEVNVVSPTPIPVTVSSNVQDVVPEKSDVTSHGWILNAKRPPGSSNGTRSLSHHTRTVSTIRTAAVHILPSERGKIKQNKRKANARQGANYPWKRPRLARLLPAAVCREESDRLNAMSNVLSKEDVKNSDTRKTIDKDNSGCMSESELSDLEKNMSFYPVSDTIKHAIYNECKMMLTGPFMMQKVCGVCDSWTKEELFLNRDERHDFYHRCRSRLAPFSLLPDILRRYYDVTEYIPELHGALISRNGIERVNKGFDEFKLRVCDPCYNSLMRGKEDEDRNHPKFSIANGFAIGQLPNELRDATLTERRLTSLTTIKGHTVVARGGKQKSIKSHILVFSAQPHVINERIAELLQKENKLLLIFTNPMTDAQKKATMRRYQARRDKIGALLNFYLENNDLYKALTKSGEDMNRLDNTLSKTQLDLDNENIVYNVENESISEEITGDQSNIRRPVTFDCAQNRQEELIVHQDASLLTAHRAAEEETILKMASTQVIDVQQSGKLIPSSSPNFFSRVFPHLFPFGRGHPDEKRKVSVSMPECVKHYLKLSSRAFVQDETFPLVAFDIVSRKRAMSHIALTCKLNPHDLEELDEFSAKDLAKQLDQEARKREALKLGHKFAEPTRNETGKKLLSRVQAVLGKTFATNEERKIYQRKAWNMAAKFHSASVFITVTPNENGNATVAFFAGSVNSTNLAAIKRNDIPANAARNEISGKDPVACDTFFTNTLDILIDKMIGFDVKRKLPKKRGGLFGVPRAYMGGIESQGKGTLHVHLIVFLAGFPKDSNELVDLMNKDESFKSRLFSFHSSIASSSAFENEGDLFCSSCKSRGTMKPVEFNKLAFTKTYGCQTPTKTAECIKCSKCFGGDEIIRNTVGFMKKSLIDMNCSHLLWSEGSSKTKNQSDIVLSPYDINDDRQVAVRAAIPTIPPLPSKSASAEEQLAHKIYLTQLLLLNQSHRWQHAKSCFKKSANSEDGYCRYNFPRATQLSIDADETGRILSKRTTGSEYINSFNDILFQVVRSNHDVRFLLCCAHEIYYTIKYVVKDQNTIDNIAAITLSSYTKKLEKEKSIKQDRSITKNVYGRIASIAYARSDLIEVGAVTAVHYLLHGTTFISSHCFEMLHLGRHLNDLNKSETDLGIVPYGKAYIAFNLTCNYKLRPLELDHECLYDYTEEFYLTRDIPKNIESSSDCMKLHPEHPFYSTKVVRRRKSKAVADIVGPRIPDLYDISEDDMEQYSKISLILFKPHRNSADILGEFRTYTEAFLRFQQEPTWTTSQGKQILSNMQQYYIGKRRAQEMRQAQLENFEGGVDFSDEFGNDDINNEEYCENDDDRSVDQNQIGSMKQESLWEKLKPSDVQNILESIVEKLNTNGNEQSNKEQICFKSENSLIMIHLSKAGRLSTIAYIIHVSA